MGLLPGGRGLVMVRPYGGGILRYYSLRLVKGDVDGVAIEDPKIHRVWGAGMFKGGPSQFPVLSTWTSGLLLVVELIRCGRSSAWSASCSISTREIGRWSANS